MSHTRPCCLLLVSRTDQRFLESTKPLGRMSASWVCRRNAPGWTRAPPPVRPGPAGRLPGSAVLLECTVRVFRMQARPQADRLATVRFLVCGCHFGCATDLPEVTL